jgi:hypothetical protein
MAIDTTQNKTSTSGPVDPKDKREKVEAETFKKMLDALDELLNHDHIYADDYGSACACQCQCACQCRGIL